MNIPDSPICGPAAWLGVEQRNRNDWIYLLSDAEKSELDSAIRAYRATRGAPASAPAAGAVVQEPFKRRNWPRLL